MGEIAGAGEGRSEMDKSITKLLEEFEAQRERERAARLAATGEHVCRLRRLFRFSGLHAEVACETCGEPMRETSVLEEIIRIKS